jgi:hypothetical protein
MTDLTTYRSRVRETARRIETDGYWDHTQMNAVLVRLGLEPYTKFRAVFTATGTNESGRELSSGTAEGAEMEIERLRASGLDGFVGAYSWKIASIEVKLVNLAEEIDAEADPDAGTDDLAVYKKLVRRVALQQARERDWCESGTNRYLEHLGLPPQVPVFVPVAVTTTTVQRVRVYEAEDYADAQRLVAAGDADVAVQVTVGRHVKLEGYALVDLETIKVDDADPTDSYGGNPCGAWDENHRYHCTRESGHTGQHIAGNSARVLGVWTD